MHVIYITFLIFGIGFILKKQTAHYGYMLLGIALITYGIIETNHTSLAQTYIVIGLGGFLVGTALVRLQNNSKK